MPQTTATQQNRNEETATAININTSQMKTAFISADTEMFQISGSKTKTPIFGSIHLSYLTKRKKNNVSYENIKRKL